MLLDIALPGLAADMAARGLLRSLDPSMRDRFEQSFAAGSSWADLATYAGPDGERHICATIFGADVKSPVRYPPERFDRAGQDILRGMEEIGGPDRRSVTDGATPSCIGPGPDPATGWPSTDRVEEFVLRTQRPVVHGRWIGNEIPFDDPRIVEAIEDYGWSARNDDHVAQGAAAVATTDFRDGPAGRFAFPPQCYMHRPASFIPGLSPYGVEVGTDAVLFCFPA